MNYSYARALSLLALLALPLKATDVPAVRGQVHFSGHEYVPGFFAGMEDIVSHVQIHRVDIALDGTFEFRGVPTGDYVLRVTNLNGDVIHQQFTTVHEHMDELSVNVPESVRGERTNSLAGKVSMTQLLHPPDKKAVQAFHTATRLSESGKYDQAVSELEKAVRISPEFGQAYTNLAVQHMRLGQYELAAAESTRAIQIGGQDPVNLCNLAFAQFQLHHYEEAEVLSRAALRLDSGYLQAHLVLGTVLALNRTTYTEAITHLQLAARRFASARRTLDALRAAR
jgi:tetratricopeptide (TPR) repeat protein